MRDFPLPQETTTRMVNEGAARRKRVVVHGSIYDAAPSGYELGGCNPSPFVPPTERALDDEETVDLLEQATFGVADGEDECAFSYACRQDTSSYQRFGEAVLCAGGSTCP
eukprot:COSAG04_NODE_1602_length_6190_cov_2.412576_5_plen_110_part_00